MSVSSVDLARYPLDQSGTSGYRELAEQSARAFAERGVALLPRFLTDSGLAAIAAEAQRLVPQAFFCRREHTVFLETGFLEAGLVEPGFLDTDPPRRGLRTNVGSIANDFLDPAGALQQLYDSDWLAGFVADVVGIDKLYPSADPLGALSINVFAPGDAHAWHFDESLFTVTLMVQEAELGGQFDYVTGLRSDVIGDIDDLDSIAAVLDGNESLVNRLPFRAGTLSIFQGRQTMHRVTTVEGARHRLVPVLTYATEPGYRNSDQVRELFWGRTG